MPDYLQHGRRHGPGGSDPIPGLVASAVAYCTGTTSSIAPGGNAIVAFSSFYTTDSSIFGTNTTAATTAHNTTGDKYLFGTGLGFYLAFAMTSWSASPANVRVNLGDDGSQWDLNVIGSVQQPTEVYPATTPSGGTIGTSTFRMFYCDSGDKPMITALHCANADTGAHQVTGSTLAVYYIAAPTADLALIY